MQVSDFLDTSRVWMAVPEVDAMYRDAAHYDRMWGRGYVEVWLSQARVSGGPLLEIGYGAAACASLLGGIP